MPKLKFQKGNAKLDKGIHHISLPAGKTCPGASECHSSAVKKDGKIRVVDGPKCKFRCFAASQEALYPQVYRAREHNHKLLKQAKRSGRIKDLILNSLPKNAQIVRIHVSGDFFSQAYLDGWIRVAQSKPEILFYAYTKSLPYWVARQSEIPNNLVLTASMGGKFDELIDKYGLRYARVVYSEEEANRLGLSIDHDDSHAMATDGESFALLLHGVQPKASEAAKALVKLRKAGKGGYGK